MELETRADFGWPATSAPWAPCTNGLVVHYDGSDQGLAGKPHSACREYWRATRRFHMGPNGWRDIGYSYGVCPHGVVFEGRGWQREQAAQPGGNTTWTSVTFMSGPGESPTAAQRGAFRALRTWLRGRGLGAGLRGHRDFIATSCPGDRLYDLLRGGLLDGPVDRDWMEDIVQKLPTLKRGAKGEHVQTAQALLRARSHLEVKMNGTFDAVTDAAVRAVQRWGGVTADGIIGPKTWPVLLRVHKE